MNGEWGDPSCKFVEFVIEGGETAVPGCESKRLGSAYLRRSHATARQGFILAKDRAKARGAVR